MNLYAYVEGDPISKRDPLGLEAWGPFGVGPFGGIPASLSSLDATQPVPIGPQPHTVTVKCDAGKLMMCSLDVPSTAIDIAACLRTGNTLVCTNAGAGCVKIGTGAMDACTTDRRY